MATKEATRRASAEYHAKRKADGWRKVTIWLSPAALANMEALKVERGWSADEAVRRCLAVGSPAEAAKERTSKPPSIKEVARKAGLTAHPKPVSTAAGALVPLASDIVRKPYQKKGK